MRLKIIACKALFRELSYHAAISENAVDITWMRQGFHSTPDKLRVLLQKEIDEIEAGTDPHSLGIREDMDDSAWDFDAILLGYGLCSNATAGLRARRHRLVIPRAHDCITLFLGSKERYAACFREIPGCFWYTASWIENSRMPGRETQERNAKRYAEMGYDEETIEYLLTETGGLNNYHNAAYIGMPFGNNGRYAEMTRDAAAYFGWDYREIPGNLSLLERFVAGEWNDEDFLVLDPGETAVQAVDERIIKAKPADPG